MYLDEKEILTKSRIVSRFVKNGAMTKERKRNYNQ